MKTFMVLCLIVCMIGGCTTLRPIANAPSDLSQRFGDGGVLEPGDRVVITTVAGATHRFRVRSVHDGIIYGEHDAVPFSEISSVQKRETSAPKTAILVVALLGLAGVLAASINAASHPPSGL